MKRHTLQPGSFGLSILYMLFIISFSVVITLNFRALYYYDMDKLHISSSSGLSEEEIRSNYDALIDYNSMFYQGNLHFPTLAMSEPGRIHFVEVKNIFVFVQYLCIFTFLLGLTGTVCKVKKKDYRFLKTSSLLTVLLPIILGTFVALNWDRFFVAFHKVFFNNDYWIFDPALDPVITILPDTFFMHCAIMILGLVVTGSILCYVLYQYFQKKDHSGT